MAEERNGELRLIATMLDKMGRDIETARAESREGIQRIHERIEAGNAALAILAQHGLPARVDKLESNWTWLFRGVVMALVVGALGLLFVRPPLP